MNIANYTATKAYDKKHKTRNVKVLLVNGAPALQTKKYDPDTGEALTNEDEVGLDDEVLAKREADLQAQLDGIKALRADMKALGD